MNESINNKVILSKSNIDLIKNNNSIVNINYIAN